MKYIKVVFFLILFFVFIFIAYAIYFKPITVNELLISKNLSTQQFTFLNVFNDDSIIEIKDENKINNLLSYIKQLTIEPSFKKNIPHIKNTYLMIFDNPNDSISIRIEVLSENYIEICSDVSNKIRCKKYRVLNKPIDIEYISDLLK
jgi:hypothetical protein